MTHIHIPGSFGAYPSALRPIYRRWEEEANIRPDKFLRYDYPKLLLQSRQVVADLVKASVEDVVFVQNATLAFNVILRNVVFQPGDVIIYMPTTFGSCITTIQYISETTPAEAVAIDVTLPLSDAALCEKFEATITEIQATGKNVKMAVFDTIASFPGARLPYERLTQICKAHNVLSLVDAAHSIGHHSVDLEKLDPDFFFSNLYKWLHVPRPCCFLYVAKRNQALIRSTVPTSFFFIPLPEANGTGNALPPSLQDSFALSFEFVGSLDNSAYLCTPAALEWRKMATWKDLKGEEAIMQYCNAIAKRGGEIVSSALGTDVMQNEDGTLTDCAFANVRLPLDYQAVAGGDAGAAGEVEEWLSNVLVEEYGTFMNFGFYGEKWWVRLSGQVYLDGSDFEWAADLLKEVCARVVKGDWKSGK